MKIKLQPVEAATLLMKPAHYYSHFILAQTKVQSVISLIFKVSIWPTGFLLFWYLYDL